jgi:phosphoglycerol transferase MdoB-like AlkP superfamily enzyme
MVIAVYSLLTLSLFSIARILLYFFYFHKKKSLKPGEVIRCLWLGLPFDLSIFMTFFGIPILLYFLPFGFSKLGGYQYSIFFIWFIFFLAAFLVTLGDLLYFKYVKRHLTNELRFFLTETNVLLKTFVKGYLFVAVGAFILLLTIAWLWFKIPGFFPYNDDGFAVSLTKFIFALFLVIYFMHGKGLSGKPIATVDANRSVSREEAMLIMNSLFSSTHYLYNARKRRFISIMDDKEAEKRVLDLINPDKRDIHPEAPLFQLNNHSLPSGRKKNIVLIVIEGFNSHNIPSLFKNTPSPWTNYNVMPFTSGLAEKSWSFTNFFANGQRTIDMVHTLLTSIPRLGGVPLIGYDHDFSITNYSYLPQILKKNGYSGSVYNGPWAKSIHMDSIASLAGFDSYIAGEDINKIYLPKSNLAAAKVGAWDEHLFDLVYKNLSKKMEPYFSLVFTATSHAPYQVPDKEYEVFGVCSERE